MRRPTLFIRLQAFLHSREWPGQRARSPTLFISGFFVRALAYYLAFLAVWPVIGNWYADTYRSTGTMVFRNFPPHGTVFIAPLDKPTKLLDSELRLGNDKTMAIRKQSFSARYHGYAPTRLMLSLILASPVPWERRIWAVIFGLLLIHVWIMFELALMVFDGYTGDHAAAMYTFSPGVMKGVAFVARVATETIVPRYVIPGVMWIVVTFRRGDWDRFVRMMVPDGD
ncbi:MAG: hypothetical protein ACE5HE_13620 [Phycisphaerae bacterium]